MSDPRREEHHRCGKANLPLILQLLAVWAVISYGCGILFVERDRKLAEARARRAQRRHEERENWAAA